MSGTAPPDLPPVDDPELDPASAGDDPEALIEEARQRARRRRLRYAAATAVLVLIGVSLIIVFGRSGPSLSASSGSPSPALAGPPDQDEAATLIAHHFELHTAYLLVYDDGRVIWQLDYGNPWDAGPMFERHLTAAGVDLVRSGAVQPRSILIDLLRTDLRTTSQGEVVSATAGSWLPAGAWADTEIRTYEPSRYAYCPMFSLGASVGQLPAAAQALLRGKLRTYNNVGLLTEGEPFPTQCLELSTEEARALRTTLIDAGYHLQAFDDLDDLDEIPWFIKQPILPHGEWVAFPG